MTLPAISTNANRHTAAEARDEDAPEDVAVQQVHGAVLAIAACTVRIRVSTLKGLSRKCLTPFAAACSRFSSVASPLAPTIGQVRPEVAQRDDGLAAVEPRHLHVDQGQVERLGGAPEERDRLGAVRGRRHAEAEVLERAAHDEAHRLLVVDDEDVLALAARKRRPASGFACVVEVRRGQAGRRRRKEDGEGRAHALGRHEGDEPAVGLHDRARRREAEPAAAADALRREERVEDLAPQDVGDAAARVRDVDPDEIPGHGVRVRPWAPTATPWRLSPKSRACRPRASRPGR